MIKKITVKNFQSHKNTVLNLSEGVNIITGISDSGKTAIVRSLRWLLFNRPIGFGFRSHWAKGKDITSINVDGIERRRNDFEDEYYIDGQIFKAMKGEVPQEIKNKLGLEEINVQYQINLPFLLCESSGKVARILNDIVGLDDIGRILGNINSIIKETSMDIKVINKEIEKIDEDIQLHIYVEDLKNDVGFLETYLEEYEKISYFSKGLEDSIEHIKDIQEHIYFLEKRNVIDESCSEIESLGWDWREMGEEISILQSCISNLKHISNHICQLNKVFEKEQDCIILESLGKEYMDEDRMIIRLQTLITLKSSLENEIEQKRLELGTEGDKYIESLLDLGECPLCFTKLNRKKIKEIRGKLEDL